MLQLFAPAPELAVNRQARAAHEWTGRDAPAPRRLRASEIEVILRAIDAIFPEQVMFRWSCTIIVAGAAALSLGCHDITRPAFSLTGNWSWYSGVDTYGYFNLKENGPVVAGEFVYMVGNGVPDSEAVTGHVNGRIVLLQFGTEISHVTLTGLFSQDGQTVAVRESLNGGQPTTSLPLRRTGQPN